MGQGGVVSLCGVRCKGKREEVRFLGTWLKAMEFTTCAGEAIEGNGQGLAVAKLVF